MFAGRSLLCALLLSSLLCLCTMVPLSFNGQALPVAFAHALLLRSDPAANAVLNAPPQRVRLWFSEELNDLTSKAIVVDTTNHQVDTGDSAVSGSDPKELSVSLPLLHAGTYVVVWRSQSAQDGHITGGSFIFRIARPDGSVPPVPSVLPSGHFPGAAGNGASGAASLDAPTLIQTLSTWLALLCLTLWAGGVLWEALVLPPGRYQRLRAVARASLIASRQFRRLAPYFVLGILLFDCGIVLGQAAEISGTVAGAVSPAILRSVLLSSSFGRAWWIRQGVALLALLLLLCMRWRGWNVRHVSQEQAPSPLDDEIEHALLLVNRRWPQAFREALADMRALPEQIIGALQERTRWGHLEGILVLGGLIAFALSGHAAAVPLAQRRAALCIDVLHLLCTAIWVGGLGYLAFFFLPATKKMELPQRAACLAQGLPAFSGLALLSVLLLAATGSLNTSYHLDTLAQFYTTLYGRLLLVKIALFLLMAALSAYHAFLLRPRLQRYLANRAKRLQAVSTADQAVSGTDAPLQERPGGGRAFSVAIQSISNQIGQWIQWEAWIGILIVLCVAFLAAFAGTLSPVIPPQATSTQSSGPIVQTKTASGYQVTLRVSPATFGSNTFTVTIKDKSGHALQGASVLVQTDMVEMDMGTDVFQLKQDPASPTTYREQSDITMAGHWDVMVKVLPPGQQKFVPVSFTIFVH